MSRQELGRPIRERDNFLVFGSPYIGETEIQAVNECLRSGWVGTGPRVAQFEREFSQYTGSPYAAAVSSCTAALHLSLVSLGLKPGAEVITTPMTFCATVNAIIHAGLTPVLADIDPETMNIDPDEVEKRLSDKTCAILPVHFAGRSCDMEQLGRIAAEHDLKIVEDCAHAIETTYRGRHAGTFGEYGCFSFYVTKNVVTAEGGMVITRSERHAADIKTLGLHGMDKDAWKRFGDEGYKHYDVVASGFKYNMTDIQAALGIPQLRRVEESWLRRSEIWHRYNEAFADLPVKTPGPVEPDTRHAHHLYTLLIDEALTGISRDDFLHAMARHGIGVGVHYRSVPEHSYYQSRFGWSSGDYPVSERIGRETVSIPLSAKLTDKDVDDVINAVRSIVSGPGRPKALVSSLDEYQNG